MNTQHVTWENTYEFSEATLKFTNTFLKIIQKESSVNFYSMTENYQNTLYPGLGQKAVFWLQDVQNAAERLFSYTQNGQYGSYSRSLS